MLKVAGLSQSAVEERLKPYYDARPGEPLTILASGGQIELHLQQPSMAEIEKREKELLSIFAERVFGFDDDSLESVVGTMLRDRTETLATAVSGVSSEPR